jgi:hypothetical protein
MLERRFNRYTEKVRFFEVGDLPLEHPEAAMNKLAVLVEKLFDGISLMRQDSR